MKIAIIGGGISGLTAAYKLARDYEVVIFEKEEVLGGLASSYMIDWDGKKYPIAKTYHHILDKDVSTIRLIKELGLKKEYFKSKVKQGFVYKGKILGFSSLMEIIKFPALFIDKIRLAKFTFFDSKFIKLDKLRKINVKDWITLKAGKKNFEIFFSQLIKNKFHTSAKEISASWFIARFVKESASFFKKFGWLEKGVKELIEKLSENVETKGGKIYTNSRVYKIAIGKEKELWYQNKGRKEKMKVDIIVNTAPPEVFLNLIDHRPKGLKSLEKIDYLSCICVSVGLNKTFTSIYWLNVLEKNLPFSAIFNHTALYKNAAPPKKSVFYIVTYLDKEEPFGQKSGKEIFKIYLRNIDKIIPKFSESVEWWKIARFKYAEAKYQMGFINPPISYNDVYFAGIYRIYPKIRNMASAIESGLEVAKRIKKEKG